jgi:hypothetical protein
MVGAFNDSWNSYKADPIKGLNAFGAQSLLTPTEVVLIELYGWLC